MDDADGSRFDVFVSYASEDKDDAREFVAFLKAQGFSVWFDEEQLAPGFEPRVAIVQGLQESRHVLIWITDAWLRKPWTRWELAHFASTKGDDDRRVVPVLRVPWDTAVLGPYLTERTAVPADLLDAERRWLAVCGLRGEGPGERGQWSHRGREFERGARDSERDPPDSEQDPPDSEQDPRDSEPLVDRHIGEGSGARAENALPSLTQTPTTPRPSSRFSWPIIVSLLFLLTAAAATTVLVLSPEQESPVVVEACRVRVEGSKEVGRAWIVLDFEAQYDVAVDGAILRFTCPPASSKVAVVIDLKNGGLRYWDDVLVSTDHAARVAIAQSRPGIPPGLPAATAEAILDGRAELADDDGGHAHDSARNSDLSLTSSASTSSAVVLEISDDALYETDTKGTGGSSETSSGGQPIERRTPNLPSKGRSKAVENDDAGGTAGVEDDERDHDDQVNDEDPWDKANRCRRKINTCDAAKVVSFGGSPWRHEERPSKAQIKAAVDLVRDDARFCGPKHGLQPGTTVRSRVGLMGIIGRPFSIRVVGDHEGTPAGRCVAEVLERLDTPGFAEPHVFVYVDIVMVRGSDAACAIDSAYCN